MKNMVWIIYYRFYLCADMTQMRHQNRRVSAVNLAGLSTPTRSRTTCGETLPKHNGNVSRRVLRPTRAVLLSSGVLRHNAGRQRGFLSKSSWMASHSLKSSDSVTRRQVGLHDVSKLISTELLPLNEQHLWIYKCHVFNISHLRYHTIR